MPEFSEEDIQFFVNNIERLKNDPIFFAKHILNIELHKGQEEIVSAIKDNRLIAAKCGRRWGKTFCFSVAAAWLVSTNKNYRIVCLAPTQRQANELFQAISKIILDSVLCNYVIQNTATKLKLSNGSSVESVPGRNPDSIRGLGISCLLCDEAAYISTSMFNSIYATIANVGKKTSGSLVVISTPGIRSGGFYNAFQPNSRYKTFEMTYDNAVYSDGTRHMSDEELEMFADLCGGRESAEFQREFMCQWGETDDAFFDPDGIEKSFSREVEQIRYGIPGHKYVFGVDVGLSKDFTIIAILDITDKSNLKIVRTVRFTGKESDEIMDILYREALGFSPKNVLIDDGRAGVAIISHLKLVHPDIKWTPFNFNIKSKSPLLYDLNMAMCTGILHIPEDPQIREELISYCYSYNQNTGHMKLNGVGCHDDFCVALALCIRAANVFTRNSDYFIGTNEGVLSSDKKRRGEKERKSNILYL